MISAKTAFNKRKFPPVPDADSGGPSFPGDKIKHIIILSNFMGNTISETSNK